MLVCGWFDFIFTMNNMNTVLEKKKALAEMERPLLTDKDWKSYSPKEDELRGIQEAFLSTFNSDDEK